ncbi:MAG: hypothetical protein AB8B64_16675 [Granulosicoccus sp.]
MIPDRAPIDATEPGIVDYSVSRQAGMVLSEYLVGTLFVAIALFAPVPGFGDSAFVFMLEALRGFQANTTYLMSMP